jgi:hypothetical protein
METARQDQTAPTPVFARPCSHTVDTQKFELTASGQLRSAAASDDRCISVAGCAPPVPPSAGRVDPRNHAPSSSTSGVSSVWLRRSRDQQGAIKLAACNGKPSQEWNLTGDPSVVTDVQSTDGGCVLFLASVSSFCAPGLRGLDRAEKTRYWVAVGSVDMHSHPLTGCGEQSGSITRAAALCRCWEINGCGGASIDTNYGCKKLPSGPKPWTGCNNMAWTFLKNGSIISGMQAADGADQCLQVCV